MFNGQPIARIYRIEHGPSAGEWAWFMSCGGPDANGRSESLEAALAEVKRRHETTLQKG